jgi:hypothetical protein
MEDLQMRTVDLILRAIVFIGIPLIIILLMTGCTPAHDTHLDANGNIVNQPLQIHPNSS